MKPKPKYCKHNASCDAKKINHNCIKSSAKCLGGTEDSIYIHCKNFKETKYKAKENAKREVFEQTQSYVEGKRQAALKYYQEYKKADESQKQGLKSIISQDFANFNEDKYLTGELYNFIYDCKYN